MSGDGMTDRLSPLSMPDDWQELGESYRDYCLASEWSDEHDRLADPRARVKVDGGLAPPPIKVVPTLDECYRLFETAMSQSDFQRAFFDPAEDELFDDGDWKTSGGRSLETQHFAYSWMKMHTTYPPYLGSTIVHGLLIVHTPSIHLIMGRTTIVEAYDDIAKEHSDEVQYLRSNGHEVQIGNLH